MRMTRAVMDMVRKCSARSSDEFYVVITFICCWLKSGLGGEESQFFFTQNLYKREIKKAIIQLKIVNYSQR